MNRSLACAAMALTLTASAAFAQPAPNLGRPGPDLVTKGVILDQFDAATGTYSGYVHVSGQPCPKLAYNVPIRVAGVKNQEEALRKVDKEIAQISENIRQASTHCAAR